MELYRLVGCMYFCFQNRSLIVVHFFFYYIKCDCTLKQRQRSVTCVRAGKQVNDRDCVHEIKPDETVSCYSECNSPHWETYLWEPVNIRLYSTK